MLGQGPERGEENGRALAGLCLGLQCMVAQALERFGEADWGEGLGQAVFGLDLRQ